MFHSPSTSPRWNPSYCYKVDTWRSECRHSLQFAGRSLCGTNRRSRESRGSPDSPRPAGSSCSSHTPLASQPELRSSSPWPAVPAEVCGLNRRIQTCRGTAADCHSLVHTASDNLSCDGNKTVRTTMFQIAKSLTCSPAWHSREWRTSSYRTCTWVGCLASTPSRCPPPWSRRFLRGPRPPDWGRRWTWDRRDGPHSSRTRTEAPVWDWTPGAGLVGSITRQ